MLPAVASPTSKTTTNWPTSGAKTTRARFTTNTIAQREPKRRRRDTVRVPGVGGQTFRLPRPGVPWWQSASLFSTPETTMSVGSGRQQTPVTPTYRVVTSREMGRGRPGSASAPCQTPCGVFLPGRLQRPYMKSTRKGLRDGELYKDNYERLNCTDCEMTLKKVNDPDEVFSVRTCPECGREWKELR
jgi:hypothetical protein